MEENNNSELSADEIVQSGFSEDTSMEENNISELSADEIVQSGFSEFLPMHVDESEEDAKEEMLIQKFVENGCGCNLGSSKNQCSYNITINQFRAVRSNMAELTHDELDLVIMGQVMAGTFQESTFRSETRQRGYTTFFHQGSRICQKTFLFLHTIGYSRFKSIKSSYLYNGIEPRVHKSKGRHRKSGLSLDEVKGLVQFIMNYAGM